MKQRARRHLLSAKLGYMETTFNAVCRNDTPFDPWTGEKLKKRRFRMLIKQGRGFFCWREARRK